MLCELQREVATKLDALANSFINGDELERSVRLGHADQKTI